MGWGECACGRRKEVELSGKEDVGSFTKRRNDDGNTRGNLLVCDLSSTGSTSNGNWCACYTGESGNGLCGFWICWWPSHSLQYLLTFRTRTWSKLVSASTNSGRPLSFFSLFLTPFRASFHVDFCFSYASSQAPQLLWPWEEPPWCTAETVGMNVQPISPFPPPPSHPLSMLLSALHPILASAISEERLMPLPPGQLLPPGRRRSGNIRQQVITRKPRNEKSHVYSRTDLLSGQLPTPQIFNALSFSLIAQPLNFAFVLSHRNV